MCIRDRAPAVLLYLVICKASRRDWLYALTGSIAGLLTLLGCYYWLAARDPIAGNIQSVILPNLSRYGLSTADLDTPFERVVFIATAQQFKGTLFSVPIDQVISNIRIYFISLIQSVGILWAVLALAGLLAVFFLKKGEMLCWKDGFLLGCALCILILLPANYAIRTGIVVFFLASYSLIALLAVFGLDLIKTATNTLITRLGLTIKQTEIIHRVLGLLLCGLVMFNFTFRLAPFNTIPAKPISDTSEIKLADIQWVHYYTSQQLAEGMLSQVEDGSLIFSDWRMLYAMQYVAIIQGTKPDVIIIETNPYPGSPVLTQTEMDLIESNYSTRAIYFTRIVEQLEKDYRFIRSDQEPYVYKLEKK